MRVVVVYESVYGNTHRIAEAVAAGVAEADPDAAIEVLAVDDAGADALTGTDLLVVGGPTHMHGLARSSTKKMGAKGEQDKVAAGKPAHDLDEAAYGETLRHWFHHLDRSTGAAAAFDTRFDGAPSMTGRASRGIARRLRHHGWHGVVDPESFLVDTDNTMVDGELDRAHAWGRQVAEAFAAEASTAG